MSVHIRHQSALVSVLLFLSVIAPLHLFAQTREVEIVLAGPWSYVTNPANTGQIVAIAPASADHNVAIFSGSDAQHYSSAKIKPTAGSYTLSIDGFDHDKCSSTTSTPSSLYALTVPKSAIGAALSNKGNRYAIILPKPCHYESYVTARSKIDNGSINDSTQEHAYTVWMTLHYTVANTLYQSELDGVSDDGSLTYNKQSVPFVSTTPSAALGVSIVLYNNDISEDYLCDGNSAAFFDLLVTGLWHQQEPNRIFPEQYDLGAPVSGEQTNRYNYNKCSQSGNGHSMEHAPQTSGQSMADIISIRNHISRSEFDAASNELDKLKERTESYWHGRVPEAIADDLNSAAQVIARGRGCKGCTLLDSNLVLAVTAYARNPGRTDCHAPQLDINSSVGP